MMFGYDGFGLGGGMGLGMVAFWVLIIAAILVLVRGFGAGSKASETRVSHDAPLDILRARFARGEIDKSEFEAMRRELSVR